MRLGCHHSHFEWVRLPLDMLEWYAMFKYSVIKYNDELSAEQALLDTSPPLHCPVHPLFGE